MFSLLVSVDPHVRVAGRRDGVKVAKERVMEVLDTRVIIQFLNNTVCMYVCMYVCMFVCVTEWLWNQN